MPHIFFLKFCDFQNLIGFSLSLSRATTEECPFAIVVMCTQSIFGVIMQACLAGIVFAKFTVPTKRGESIIFSRNALISMRNGALHLLVQVRDEIAEDHYLFPLMFPFP